MRLRRFLQVALVLAVSLVSIPAAAQGLGTGCDLAGTWYGGGNPATPYQVTFIPMGAGRYAVTAQQSLNLRLFGAASITPWVGEAAKTGGHTFDWYAMSYWVTEKGPDANPNDLPELDIVRSRIEIVDCNTIKNTIDLFGGYLSFTPVTIKDEGGNVLFPARTPFVSPMDFDVLADWTSGEPIEEVYHRLPIGVTPPAIERAVMSAGSAKMPGRRRK